MALNLGFFFLSLGDGIFLLFSLFFGVCSGSVLLGCALCFRSGTPFFCVCRAGLSCARVHVVVLGFDD